MRFIRLILSYAVFVSIVIFISSTIADAQTISTYLYLEILDSAGAPVPAATVELTNFKRMVVTDADGFARFPQLPRYNRDLTTSEFKVIQPGYYPFQDFGDPKAQSDEREFKLELLKIPQTKAERKMLGNEQLKREFMWAVKAGDLATARRLLKSGISPDLTTSDLRGVSAPKDISGDCFRCHLRKHQND